MSDKKKTERKTGQLPRHPDDYRNSVLHADSLAMQPECVRLVFSVTTVKSRNRLRGNVPASVQILQVLGNLQGQVSRNLQRAKELLWGTPKGLP